MTTFKTEVLPSGALLGTARDGHVFIEGKVTTEYTGEDGVRRAVIDCGEWDVNIVNLLQAIRYANPWEQNEVHVESTTDPESA